MRSILLYLTIFLSTTTLAQEIKLDIIGTNKLQTQQIKDYLGDPPENNAQQSSYIFSAEKNTLEALQTIGFYNARVKSNLNKQEDWKLEINVEVNEPTIITSAILNIKGDAKNSDEFIKLKKELKKLENKNLNHADYEFYKNKILTLGLIQGFLDGKLTKSQIIINKHINQAEIIFEYNSQEKYKFKNITFKGSNLKPKLLNNFATFTTGTAYNAKKISDLHKNLVTSGYFSSINILTQIAKAKNKQIPILVNLKPAPSHKMKIGAGYATDTKIRTSLSWSTPQINKYGHSQETRIEYSKINPYLRTRYNIPINNDIRDILQIGIDIEDDKYASFNSEIYAMQIGKIKKEENLSRHIELKLHTERWKALGNNFHATYLLPSLTYSRTKYRDDSIDPVSGFKQLYKLTLASKYLGSDQNLIKAEAKYIFVHRFMDNHRFVAKADFGASYFKQNKIDGIPPSLRFYAGGDQSLRGFGYQSLGPSVYYTDENNKKHKLTIGGRFLGVTNFEYQYYWNKNWRSSLFTDIGNAFDNLNDSLNLAHSIGTGIHWLSPVGPIKFDLGYGISEKEPPWQLHVSMGAEL